MAANLQGNYSRWLEIDLDVLQANFQAMRDFIPAAVKIMAVVKANGYGYGGIAAALAFQEADELAVTTIDEGIELRNAGISKPILVFAPPLPEEISAFYEYDLMPTIETEKILPDFAAAAQGRKIDCHLKINTGMNRFGIKPKSAGQLGAAISGQAGLKLVGVYSHLANALAPDLQDSKGQIAEFNRGLEDIRSYGIGDFTPHLANSAGAIRLPEARFAMVRLGSVLYGQSTAVKGTGLNIHDAFAAKAKIISIHEVAKGDRVGYGTDFVAKQQMRLGIIPIGYADGFAIKADTRPLSTKRAFQTMSRDVGKIVLGKSGQGVYYNQQMLPLVGRVAMQTAVIDVSHVVAEVGQTVDVPLRRTSVSARLPRVYLREAKAKTLEELLGNMPDVN